MDLRRPCDRPAGSVTCQIRCDETLDHARERRETGLAVGPPGGRSAAQDKREGRRHPCIARARVGGIGRGCFANLKPGSESMFSSDFHASKTGYLPSHTRRAKLRPPAARAAQCTARRGEAERRTWT